MYYKKRWKITRNNRKLLQLGLGVCFGWIQYPLKYDKLIFAFILSYGSLIRP